MNDLIIGCDKWSLRSISLGCSVCVCLSLPLFLSLSLYPIQCYSPSKSIVWQFRLTTQTATICPNEIINKLIQALNDATYRFSWQTDQASMLIDSIFSLSHTPCVWEMHIAIDNTISIEIESRHSSFSCICVGGFFPLLSVVCEIQRNTIMCVIRYPVAIVPDWAKELHEYKTKSYNWFESNWFLLI